MADIQIPLCSIVAIDPTSIWFSYFPPTLSFLKPIMNEVFQFPASRMFSKQIFHRALQIASWNLNICYCPGSYQVCGSCERVVSEESTSYGPNVHPCEFCRRRPRNPNAPTTKHLYKLLVSSLNTQFFID